MNSAFITLWKQYAEYYKNKIQTAFCSETTVNQIKMNKFCDKSQQKLQIEIDKKNISKYTRESTNYYDLFDRWQCR